MGTRRNFIKTLAIAGVATSLNVSCDKNDKPSSRNHFLLRNDCLRITGTFIDELSRDIPYHNWGINEWDREFSYMKSIGIDTIILRQTGLDLKLLYPSLHLMGLGIPHPAFDKLEIFLHLADKYGFNVFCGLYGTSRNSKFSSKTNLEINQHICQEVWNSYGSKHNSFAGWFLNHEVSLENDKEIPEIVSLCKQCKNLSGDKPVIISPWIDGIRLIEDEADNNSTPTTYEKDWNDLLAQLSSSVDICVFQDTSVSDLDCNRFYNSCRELAHNNGLQCWANAETYDSMMPMKLYSVDFDHLRLKLDAAKQAELQKVITYEFSHFMSPQSVCQMGGYLFDRYKEYFNIT